MQILFFWQYEKAVFSVLGKAIKNIKWIMDSNCIKNREIEFLDLSYSCSNLTIF